MLTIGYNTTPSPLVVDEAGFIIPGLFWGVIDTLDEQGRKEIESGRVLKASVDLLTELVASGDAHPDVAEVLAALEARKAAREAAEAMEKDELLEVVDPEQVDRIEPGG